MIVPYLSIDLFFVAAPFLCRSERELATFSKRIVAAIVVAGICFLLFPLRFAFERPSRGRLARRSLRLVPRDGPALQLASLAPHRFPNDPGPTLSPAYSRILRAASNVWFVLVGLSTVFTYQHHVMDVVAGFALGVCCIYFIREEASDLSVIKNRPCRSLLCRRGAGRRRPGRFGFGPGAFCCFGPRSHWVLSRAPTSEWARAFFGKPMDNCTGAPGWFWPPAC